MIRIFTPQGKDTEVLIESAFNPIASAIGQGRKKQEAAAPLAEVLKALQWAGETSPPCRLKLKGATRLNAAIKKAGEQGTDDLKAAALAFQRSVRG
jgi:hypothetical protein